MIFICPLCDTEMVRHKADRRILECPHCEAMGTSNVLQRLWANTQAVARVEQLADDMEKNMEPIPQNRAAQFIRDRLFRGVTR